MKDYWNLDGRKIVNWRSCAWEPYPGLGGTEPAMMWNPIRANAETGDGYYLLKIKPDAGAALHAHSAQEEFIILEGSLTDTDGTVLEEGDCVSYDPGTRHRTHSPNGCVLLAYIAGPIARCDGNDNIEEMRAGRRIVNWHTSDYTLYPSLSPGDDPIFWHPIRADGETGEGFYLVRFEPGTSSSPHVHTGIEEFAMLQGELVDPDGTVYTSGDCISLPAGTAHHSYSPDGCVTVAMISGPLEEIHDAFPS